MARSETKVRLESSLSVLRQRLGKVFPWRWSVEDAGVG